MKLKHINDLLVGDEIIIEIPSVCTYVEKVVYINKELKFVFLEGNCDVDDIDEQTGIQFLPNEDGYFKVP